MTATMVPQQSAPVAASGTDSGILPALAGAATCLLPFLHPAGPGNTGVADVAICGAIVVAFLWISRNRIPLAFPYVVGVSGLMMGGAFASATSGAPLSTLLVLAQDALLFLWGMTLALGSRDARIVSAVTTAWCRTAAVYASVVVVAYLVGFSPLSGVTARDGARAAYTFGDPNLAGNYLVMSLFVIAACRRPRSATVRHFTYVMLLTAITFTGSNGALLTLVLGATLTLAISAYRRRGVRAGVLTLVATVTIGASLVTYVETQVNLDQVRQQMANSVPLIRDSLARSGGSESQRATILQEGFHLFLQGDGTGYGPGQTKTTLERTQAPYVKEAHNDYLAALLERGVLGEISLFVLGGAMAARCIRLLIGRLPPEYEAIVPRAWLLVVILPATAVSSTFYEVLHFRHLWTWLGLIAALVLVIERQERPQPSARREEMVR
ncbi:MAG: O-antigen ligase family protein [Nocardioides sp.]|nr:O-antigen ligase family protein [Nocardioides sp.]